MSIHQVNWQLAVRPVRRVYLGMACIAAALLVGFIFSALGTIPGDIAAAQPTKLPGVIIADLLVFGSLISFMGLLVFFSLRALKQREQILGSIQIELGEDYIVRRRINAPEIRIARNEIKELTEIGTDLWISTRDKYRCLNVPKSLEGYDQVAHVLKIWAPVHKPGPRPTLAAYIPSLLFILLSTLMLLTGETWLVVFLALAAIGINTYLYWVASHAEAVLPYPRSNLIWTNLFVVITMFLKLFLIWVDSLPKAR
ncbi:MAG: hypothetical protein WCF84_27380 [Anaerolineae bacterium]